MKARICVVTAAHLSGCPRMLKAADALHAAGYRVRVVSTRYVDWCTKADDEVRRVPGRGWRWTQVSFERGTLNWLRSGVRSRAARRLVDRLGPARTPMPIAIRAHARFHRELVEAISAEPTDFIYGGTGMIPPTIADAARRLKVPFAIDLEDFHSEEHYDAVANQLSERIERTFLAGAAFLTAGSAAIRDAYTERYALQPIAIHNTFALPTSPPSIVDEERPALGLYWFSQTIGSARGLEDAIAAVGAAKIPVRLHLRGNPLPGYLERLRSLAERVAPGLVIEHLAPISPDELVASCHPFAIGLALEPGDRGNNRLALSNKALTYPLGGLAVLMTSTPGQLELGRDLGEGAVMARPGDIDALAEGLRRWSHDRAALRRARVASWEAARRRWHWEHVQERGALLTAVGEVVGR